MTKSPNTTDKEQQETKIELLEAQIESLDAQILAESKSKKCDIDKCIDLLRTQSEKEAHLEYFNNVINGVVAKSSLGKLRSAIKTGGNKPGLSSQR